MWDVPGERVCLPLILFPSGVLSEEIYLGERSTWALFQEPSVTSLGLSWQMKTQG